MAEVKRRKKRASAQPVDVMGITHASSLVDMTQGRAQNKTDYSANSLQHSQVADKLLAVKVHKKPAGDATPSAVDAVALPGKARCARTRRPGAMDALGQLNPRRPRRSQDGDDGEGAHQRPVSHFVG